MVVGGRPRVDEKQGVQATLGQAGVEFLDPNKVQGVSIDGPSTDGEVVVPMLKQGGVGIQIRQGLGVRAAEDWNSERFSCQPALVGREDQRARGSPQIGTD
jgi:hypothetical protein